jgi:uncharacterized RDD family membrane protein YckC
MEKYETLGKHFGKRRALHDFLAGTVVVRTDV